MGLAPRCEAFSRSGTQPASPSGAADTPHVLRPDFRTPGESRKEDLFARPSQCASGVSHPYTKIPFAWPIPVHCPGPRPLVRVPAGPECAPGWRLGLGMGSETQTEGPLAHAPTSLPHQQTEFEPLRNEGPSEPSP